ncbi:MAG TPA: hypothetical protein VIM55_08445 [Mucilaginibacter sp.]
MADFQAHIQQAKKNLATLSEISLKVNDSWDWQVTCAYYTAVHLMNAHLAQTVNQHYKTHVDVKNALFNSLWPSKVPDDIYTSYSKLENLSRRARYLCHDNLAQNDPSTAYITYDRHLMKALKKLDAILVFFAFKYQVSFNISDIDCIELKNGPFKYFQYNSITNALPRS